MMRSVAAALLGSCLLVGCAHYPVNEALVRYQEDYGYRFSSIPTPPSADETFVILTFSGGGTRAASLAYGVLRHLENTLIDGGRRRLLDEVDVISSVSGGSFTAAFYALNGVTELPRFERDFLRRDVSGELVRAVALNPYNWWRLLSPRFSRIDLAAEYYDRHLFDRRTYRDLIARQRRPYLVINASEMDLGARFEFTQEQLNPICSDLKSITIGRAVAASSAFPVLLSPITLKNHAGTCGYREPQWMSGALQDFATNARRYRSALELRAYTAGDRPYLHLMDGGIADNIGLRGMLHALSSQDGELSVLQLMNLKRVKRVAVIAVNARTESPAHLDRREGTPSIVDVLLTTSTAPMGNYSFETVELLRNSIDEWNRDARSLEDCGRVLKDACPGAQIPGGPLASVEFYPIEVAFASIRDPVERAFFNDIGTNYSLAPEQVTRLIELGPKLLDASTHFRDLVKRLQ